MLAQTDLTKGDPNVGREWLMTPVEGENQQWLSAVFALNRKKNLTSLVEIIRGVRRMESNGMTIS